MRTSTMNAPFHSSTVRRLQNILLKRHDAGDPDFCLPDTANTVPCAQCTAASLRSVPLPDPVSCTNQWKKGAVATAIFHSCIALVVFLGGLYGIAAEDPPLQALPELSLQGFGSPGGNGGDGQAGSGSPAKAASQGMQQPSGEAAQPETPPAKPDQGAKEESQAPVPPAVPEPKPILDAKAAQKTPPKPGVSKRHKLAEKLRSLVAHTQNKAAQETAAQASAPKGPVTAPNAPENGLGTGMGTGQGDGAGVGPGKGLGHGDGPPGIGGGPGGPGHGYTFGQGDGPRFRHRAMPSYPSEAKMENKEGMVTLLLTIDQSGVLRNVEVVKHTGLEFVDEALRAIKSSTFYPATHAGSAISCRALLTIRFKLG